MLQLFMIIKKHNRGLIHKKQFIYIVVVNRIKTNE